MLPLGILLIAPSLVLALNNTISLAATQSYQFLVPSSASQFELNIRPS